MSSISCDMLTISIFMQLWFLAIIIIYLFKIIFANNHNNSSFMRWRAFHCFGAKHIPIRFQVQWFWVVTIQMLSNHHYDSWRRVIFGKFINEATKFTVQLNQATKLSTYCVNLSNVVNLVERQVIALSTEIFSYLVFV